MGNFKSPPAKGGSVDCFQLCFVVNAFRTFNQRFLHGDFRIVASFTLSRLSPPATFPHGDFWDSARRRVGWMGRKWYAATLVCFLIFSFFFCHLHLLQPNLRARTLPSLVTDTAAFPLEGLPGPTNPDGDGDARQG